MLGWRFMERLVRDLVLVADSGRLEDSWYSFSICYHDQYSMCGFIIKNTPQSGVFLLTTASWGLVTLSDRIVVVGLCRVVFGGLLNASE